jgi:hypothetical protein
MSYGKKYNFCKAEPCHATLLLRQNTAVVPTGVLARQKGEK